MSRPPKKELSSVDWILTIGGLLTLTFGLVVLRETNTGGDALRAVDSSRPSPPRLAIAIAETERQINVGRVLFAVGAVLFAGGMLGVEKRSFTVRDLLIGVMIFSVALAISRLL